MNAAMMRRLEALESKAAKGGTGDPARIYEAMIGNGIEAPEPLPGEDNPTWLSRVPANSLEAMLRLMDEHDKT